MRLCVFVCPPMFSSCKFFNFSTSSEQVKKLTLKVLEKQRLMRVESKCMSIHLLEETFRYV